MTEEKTHLEKLLELNNNPTNLHAINKTCQAILKDVELYSGDFISMSKHPDAMREVERLEMVYEDIKELIKKGVGE